MILRESLRRLPLLPGLVRTLRRAWRPTRRRRLALKYLAPKQRAIRTWLRESREVTNFTYDLTDRNVDYLAATVATATGCALETVRGYLREVIDDEELAQHVARVTAQAPLEVQRVSDTVARPGRRIGWYALARALKPRVVVESGVDKGLGAVVLCAALRRNAAEGAPGRYCGLDIDPNAGWLLREPYSDVGSIRFGDAQASLRAFEEPIDLFVSDSDHSPEYERGEYAAVAPKLTDRAYLVADNAHCTSELFEFAQTTGRPFLYWQEWPKDHWYPGGGIGLAFPPAGTRSGCR